MSIDAPTATRLGEPYRQEFDGVTDILTVEGPIIRENGSYAAYPTEVAQWYERAAGLDPETVGVRRDSRRGSRRRRTVGWSPARLGGARRFFDSASPSSRRALAWPLPDLLPDR
jgi:hypothetical protein